MEAIDINAVAFLLVLEDVSSEYDSRVSSSQRSSDMLDRTATMRDEALRLRVDEDAELALGNSGIAFEEGVISQSFERAFDASSRFPVDDRDARGGSIEPPEGPNSVEHARMGGSVLDAKQETRSVGFTNFLNDPASKEKLPVRAAQLQNPTGLDGHRLGAHVPPNGRESTPNQGRGSVESETIGESHPVPQRQPMVDDVHSAPFRMPNGSLVAGGGTTPKLKRHIPIEGSERLVGAEDARLPDEGAKPGQGSGRFAPLDSRGGLRSRFDRKALNRRAERLLDYERRLEELERISAVRSSISSNGVSSDVDTQLLFPL